MTNKEINYRAFLRDLKRLCKRHEICISACDEGFVGIGPSNAKTIGEFYFNHLRINPKEDEAELGYPGESSYIKM